MDMQKHAEKAEKVSAHVSFRDSRRLTLVEHFADASNPSHLFKERDWYHILFLLSSLAKDHFFPTIRV